MTKPTSLLVKKWITTVKIIDTFIPLVENGVNEYTQREIVNYLLTENIHSLWNKGFEQQGRHHL